MKALAAVFMAGALAATSGAAVAADGAQATTEARPWTISASTYAFFVPDTPDSSDFIMAIVPLDVRLLHVEGRYNYEALRSVSGFVGLNARWGEKLKLAFTPMFGGVAGDLDGLIPALRFTVTWWKLELYSENEIVFVLHDNAATFFYNWSELGIYPVSWLRAGAAIQRTHVYQTPLDIQRGAFVSGTYRFANVTLYEFNLGWTTPTWVLAMTLTF
jgi:hypothetical protein